MNKPVKVDKLWGELTPHERTRRIDPQGRAERLAAKHEGQLTGSDGHFSGILCARCCNGLVYEERGRNGIMVHCSVLRRQVSEQVVRCSSFENERQTGPSLDEMTVVALLVDVREAPPSATKGYL